MFINNELMSFYRSGPVAIVISHLVDWLSVPPQHVLAHFVGGIRVLVDYRKVLTQV